MTMFGHYRLEAPLGEGGGGEVWRAYDTRLERTVALKTMRSGLLTNPNAAERFRREARLAARLDHPNIVRVHNADQIDGRLYIDMQLVDGHSVADLLAKDGPLDPARVVSVVVSVAAALDRAHGRDGRDVLQMIHRDVKPGNILVADDLHGEGHVYLADFGVARPIGTDQALTASGDVVGTPGYLAPELWEGHDPDPRSDVYALAVTTFEMLVGTRPFPGSEWPGLMNKHLHATPPWTTSARPDLPAAVDAVIARGLAKKPDDRHPTAGGFAKDLRAALLPAPAGERPTTTRTLPEPTSDVAAPTLPPVPHTGPAPSNSLLRYLGSAGHFTGLVLASLALPLYLLGVVPSGWRLVLSGVLLYALGVVVHMVVGAGRS